MEFHRYFFRRKTRIPGLSHSVVCVILAFAVFVELRLVTDRQTDRRTHDDSMTAYTALA